MIGELKTQNHHFKLKADRLESAFEAQAMEAQDFLSTIVRIEENNQSSEDITKELKW
jgi:hypothetical protein